MSPTYTTGEMAKAAQVTVRTVQYYDQRGILSPSQISEGGRRLYSQADLEQLKLICYLRELDFSINQIKDLLQQEQVEAVLTTLIESQISMLKAEVDKRLDTIDSLLDLKKLLKSQPHFTLDHIADISLTMKNSKTWRRMAFLQYGKLLLTILIFVTLLYVSQALEQDWLAWMAAAAYLLALVYLVRDGHRCVNYLCPLCHKVFSPDFKDWILAFHTPRTRRLTCPHCHEKSDCIELAKQLD